MAKRKITKFCSAKLCHSINSLFRPLCPSDISPCKRETKQKIPPLTKGGLGGVCAFTLVELIVVVTILAIL
ncbi:MAG: type II secretion system GspH family protein [Candidatus Peribacteria bacterium]|nr:type II secretion system GspH family protein [Candidatus Peribacteria bacterium]